MSVGQLCPALCDTTDCSTSGFLSITNHWSLLTLMSIQSVMPSKHLVLCRSFSSSLQSFPTSRSFQMRQFLRPTWLCTLGCPALGEWSHHRGYLAQYGLFFVQFFCVFLPPLLNIFCFFRSIPFLSLLCLSCMKCSLAISNFLDEISSLSHSNAFLYLFSLITEEGFISFFFSAICKASSDNHFAFLLFFSLLMLFIT